MVSPLSKLIMEKHLTEALLAVRNNISKKALAGKPYPRLVAVSKTKPVEMIMTLYKACDQKHFGENYVQELVEKSLNPELIETCPDIRWHFIGTLQSNKINKLLSAKNLWIVESVQSEKIAELLNVGWEKKCDKNEALRVMVQVNTSSEDQKSGIAPSVVASLVKYILNECPHLKFVGLMTIGSIANSTTEIPNPDFVALVKCRDSLSLEVGLDVTLIELSMGMSSDYEHAIEMGSTNVRVGSSIFGARQYPSKT